MSKNPVESDMMPPPRIRQAAAIPLHDGLLCLVTSRRGQRWVIPKGCIDAGHTAEQAALAEAWEEAGVSGLLVSEPVGSYLYEKFGRTHQVTVFVMEVTQVHKKWPEMRQRDREWVTLDTALVRIEEPGLRDILTTVLTLNSVRA